MKKKTKDVLKTTTLVAASAVMIAGASGMTAHAAEKTDGPDLPKTSVDDESGKTFYATDDINSAKSNMDAAHALSDAAEDKREEAENALNQAIDDKTVMEQEKSQIEQDMQAARDQAETEIDNYSTQKSDEVLEIESYKTDKYREKADAYGIRSNAEKNYNDATKDTENARQNYKDKLDQVDDAEFADCKDAFEKEQEKYNQAVKDSEIAKHESDQADSEYTAAEMSTSWAKYGVDSIQADVDLKQHDVDAKRANEQAAIDRYNELNAYNNQSKDATQSQQYKDLEEAKEEVSQAETALSDAQAEKEDAAIAVSDSQTALETAQSDLDAAKSQQETAQSDLNNAQSAYDEAVADENSKQEAMSQAESDLASAQQALSDAQQAVTDAEKAADEAGHNVAYKQVELVEAQEAEQAAKAELEAAADKYNQGAWAFYQYLIDDPDVSDDVKTSAKWALDILNKHDADNLRQVGSATQVENIKTAIKMMKKGNELRVADKNYPGLEPLKVSLRLMAIGQYHADKSLNDHLRDLNTGENLAWGYNNPYEGWYWMELYKYNKGDRTHAVGHYTNLVGHSCEGVNLEYTVTGYGMTSPSVALGGARTDAQEFQSDPTNERGAMTVDEFEELFNRFLASIDIDTLTQVHNEKLAAVATAQQNLEDAEAAEANALKACTRAENALTTATGDVEAKSAAKEQAIAAYNAAVEAREQAQNVLTEKQNSLKAAVTAVSEKESELQSVQGEKADADTRLQTAEGTFAQAQERVSTAKTVETQAQTAYDLLFSNTALTQAKADMEEAASVRQEAEDYLHLLQRLLKKETEEYNTLNADLQVKAQNKEQKNLAYAKTLEAKNQSAAALQSLKENMNDMVTKYDELQTAKLAWDNAIVAEAQAKQEMEDATAAFEEVVREVSATDDAYHEAQEALRKAYAINFDNLEEGDNVPAAMEAKQRYLALKEKQMEVLQKIDDQSHVIAGLQTAYDDAHKNANTAYADYLFAKTSYESMLPEYTVIKGDNADWTRGDNADLEVAFDGLFDQFNDVYVDGVKVDPANYTAFAGSTHVVFHKDYLESLSAGQHEVTADFDFGKATTHITVGDKASVTPNQTSVVAAGSYVVDGTVTGGRGIADGVQTSESGAVKTLATGVDRKSGSAVTRTNSANSTTSTKAPQTGDMPVAPLAGFTLAGLLGAFFFTKKREDV